MALIVLQYIIGKEQDAEFIQCLRCGSRSFHPKDIEEKYCGFCHVFYDLEALVAHATRN